VMVDGQEKNVVSGDAERWVRDEVAFGRFTLLKVVSAAALLVALAALVLAGVGKKEKRFLQPGELHAQHATLFEGAAPERFASQAAIASAQGCSACHDTFGGAPASKCATCHADLMHDRHPFATDRSQSPLTQAVLLDDDACATCHLDHQGREPAQGAFVPTPAVLAAGCRACHPAGVPAADQRRPVKLPAQDERITYDAFSHAAHAGAKCEACHTQAPRAEDKGREFARVDFAKCMGCHGSDDPRSKFRRDPVLAALDVPVAPQHMIALAWHGTSDGGARCLACHAEKFQAALRRVQTRVADHLPVQARRRGHAELFDGHAEVADASGRARACVDCHADGQPLRANETYTGRFDHVQHLATLSPLDPRAASLECAACHAEQNAALHLAGRAAPASDDVSNALAYRGPALEKCAACHTDQDGAALIKSIDDPSEGTLSQRVDFPHARHVASSADSLRDGCFSCHSFGTDARAVTKPEAASCLPCHQTHANVGGDGCALCHPKTPSGGPDLALLAADTREKRAFVPRVPTPGFSHGSRGHDGGCTTCHAGTEKAATIHDVRMPDESDAVCWKCHVEDAQQFHWRGAASATTAPR
jgi:hypothetical protein